VPPLYDALAEVLGWRFRALNTRVAHKTGAVSVDINPTRKRGTLARAGASGRAGPLACASG